MLTEHRPRKHLPYEVLGTTLGWHVMNQPVFIIVLNVTLYKHKIDSFVFMIEYLFLQDWAMPHL